MAASYCTVISELREAAPAVIVQYVILWCCPSQFRITVAVEKRLKPAVIVQGMLFCGAAPLSSEITVAVEKRLKLQLLYKVCYSAPLSSDHITVA